MALTGGSAGLEGVNVVQEMIQCGKNNVKRTKMLGFRSQFWWLHISDYNHFILSLAQGLGGHRLGLFSCFFTSRPSRSDSNRRPARNGVNARANWRATAW
jgi:hypothetical protein